MKLDRDFDTFVEGKIKKLKPSNQLIQFLKSKKNIGSFYISTGTPQEKIEKILKEKRIIQYFKKIYGSPKSKVCHINEIKKNRKTSIFIGDSFEDFRAAKSTGIQFILKINSENSLLRKKEKVNTISSFKFLEKKIQYLH